MIIGVDVGYGYTKAVGENSELLFPSVVGTGFERKMEKLISGGHSNTDNFDLYISPEEHYFVGELAMLQSPDARRPFSDNRSSIKEIKPALLTAVAKLSTGEPVTLITGLPLEPFFKQAKSLKESLESISGLEVLLNNKPITIFLKQVIMFPQAVAALYGQLMKNGTGDSGIVGLVDIGFATTDIVLFDVASKKFLDKFNGTITHGVNDVIIGIQDEIKSELGFAPDLEEIEQSLIKETKLHFNKKEYDVSQLAVKQKKALETLLVANIRRRWRDHEKKLKVVYLAGGGASIIQEGISEFANCEIIRNAQFANAKGYLQKGILMNGLS